MKITNPLTPFLLFLFVTHWNNSNLTERKRKIMEKLVVCDPRNFRDGMRIFEALIRDELSWHQSALAAVTIDEKIIATLASIAIVKPRHDDFFYTSFRAEVSISSSQVRDEIACYFYDMFSLNHFEQIPLPKFNIKTAS